MPSALERGLAAEKREKARIGLIKISKSEIKKLNEIIHSVDDLEEKPTHELPRIHIDNNVYVVTISKTYIEKYRSKLPPYIVDESDCNALDKKSDYCRLPRIHIDNDMCIVTISKEYIDSDFRVQSCEISESACSNSEKWSYPPDHVIDYVIYHLDTMFKKTSESVKDRKADTFYCCMTYWPIGMQCAVCGNSSEHCE